MAVTSAIDSQLTDHLLRDDGQEDLCLATYSLSSGAMRKTMIIRSVVLPEVGERGVHGNASFTGDYVLRVATMAAKAGHGIVILHSHPNARGWQQLSGLDHDAESSYAYLVSTITGVPLVGMTLAGDRSWSARVWNGTGGLDWVESVRVVGTILKVTWNEQQRPAPRSTASQLRTVSAWGESLQADLARLRVLVVGVGSVGLDVAQRLAASGLLEVGVMDFDSVESVNRDRMVGATRADVRLNRSKAQVALRLMIASGTAATPAFARHEMSICEPEGLAVALDYDLVISCVDHPWPRGVMNVIAYADLIPVIDGGIDIQAFKDGGMRSATWRTHVLVPGRPCLICNGQLNANDIAMDRVGLLDDPRYIANAAGHVMKPSSQNVATLSASVSASLLAQFVSLVAAPGGRGVPLPLQYTLSTHSLEHIPATTQPHCRFEKCPGEGDKRVALTQAHLRAHEVIDARNRVRRSWHNRIGEALNQTGAYLLA